ncbi:MAG: DUF2975 domain-containing protein [Clostridia bacterium]
MFKLFDHYERVSPLLFIFQIFILLGICWTFAGIIFSLLSIYSLLPAILLEQSWIQVFLPNIQLSVGGLVFPTVLQSKYIPQLLLYAGISQLPFLFLLYYACVKFKLLFKSFERVQEPFTIANALALKQIGIAIVLTALCQFAIDFGYGGFLSLIINTAESNAAGLINVMLNLPMLFVSILLAAIFFGLAKMFTQALALKEDNDSIV